MNTGTPVAHLFLRKAEFLHLVNSGRIRMLRGRVVPVSGDFGRVFATGITTSPTDADNCVVVGLASSWETADTHPLAVKKDLAWLTTADVTAIRPVKEIDAEPLRELVPASYAMLFAGHVEREWRSWLAGESVIIHLNVAQQLLAWSGQKTLTAGDLKSPATNDLVLAMLGLDNEHPPENRSLAASFFASLAKIVRVLGPAVGTLHSPFRLAQAWVDHQSPNGAEPAEDPSLAKFLRDLEKGNMSAPSIESNKVAKRLRGFEKRHNRHFDKQLRPILMAAVADTNYRIVGGLFTADDFTRCLGAVSKFEGPLAARNYTLYTACRLGPEIVHTSLFSSTVPAAMTDANDSVEKSVENTASPAPDHSDTPTLGI